MMEDDDELLLKTVPLDQEEWQESILRDGEKQTTQEISPDHFKLKMETNDAPTDDFSNVNGSARFLGSDDADSIAQLV